MSDEQMDRVWQRIGCHARYCHGGSVGRSGADDKAPVHLGKPADRHNPTERTPPVAPTVSPAVAPIIAPIVIITNHQLWLEAVRQAEWIYFCDCYGIDADGIAPTENVDATEQMQLEQGYRR